MKEPCILLVDAEELVRTPLAQYLRECGYRVLEAIDADEAQRLLSEGSQTIDIVLADIKTLGGSGFVFAAWVRQNKPGIRVLSAGTIAAAARTAGDLCEEEPPIRKPATTNSCWIAFAASLPNVTEAEIHEGCLSLASLG